MKTMFCLITSIDFLYVLPFMRPLFSGKQELSNLDYYSQDGGKNGCSNKSKFLKIK